MKSKNYFTFILIDYLGPFGVDIKNFYLDGRGFKSHRFQCLP